MDFGTKKFSIEKALFKLDCEFMQSVPFKIYQFANTSDFNKAVNILFKHNIRFRVDYDAKTIEMLKTEEDRDIFINKVLPLFGVSKTGERPKNGKNHLIFKTYLFKKDKFYLFKKYDYTCRICGFKAAILSIGPLKIQNWETSFEVPLGLDIHIITTKNKKVAVVLCDKCHFGYHYYTQLTDDAIENWKKLK